MISNWLWSKVGVYFGPLKRYPPNGQKVTFSECSQYKTGELYSRQTTTNSQRCHSILEFKYSSILSVQLFMVFVWIFPVTFDYDQWAAAWMSTSHLSPSILDISHIDYSCIHQSQCQQYSYSNPFRVLM